MPGKYDHLFINHAYWSDKRKELRLQGQREQSQCERIKPPNKLKTCIEETFERANEIQLDSDDYGWRLFDLAWREGVEKGDICWHCQEVRRLKKERIAASRKLGGIRAAITKIGRRLTTELS